MTSTTTNATAAKVIRVVLSSTTNNRAAAQIASHTTIAYRTQIWMDRTIFIIWLSHWMVMIGICGVTTISSITVIKRRKSTKIYVMCHWIAARPRYGILSALCKICTRLHARITPYRHIQTHIHFNHNRLIYCMCVCFLQFSRYLVAIVPFDVYMFFLFCCYCLLFGSAFIVW